MSKSKLNNTHPLTSLAAGKKSYGKLNGDTLQIGGQLDRFHCDSPELSCLSHNQSEQSHHDSRNSSGKTHVSACNSSGHLFHLKTSETRF